MSSARQSWLRSVFHRLAVTATAGSRRFPGLVHPPGFYVVCTAVFLERWAAAMLGSSAVLMLCERYGYARGEALRLAGLINAASYLTTLPGGLAIDGALDPRRALGLGMGLLALGYAALTLVTPEAIWLSALLLVCGHGLFKPSAQALLARLYAPNDGRLDAAQVAFTWLSMSGAWSAR